MATTRPPTVESRSAPIAEERDFLMPCLRHFYRDPLWIARASMQYLFDENDRRYLDCFSGVGVVNCGHCNPAIQEPAFEAARKLDHTTTIYRTEPMIRLAERLASITPQGLKRSFFCSSGTEANEGAALIAALATGRKRFIAFDAGLHGRSLLTMNLTGLPMWRADTSLERRVLHLPTPHCHRCPFGLKRATCELACARKAIKTIIDEGPESFAGMIAEPILGNGGIIPLPEGYLETVSESLRIHGILLIIDEIQTGFGRTGRWFASDRTQVQVDVMTVAKALANGIPVGAFIATDAAAAACDRPGASTFGGNVYSMAAALATLDYLEAEDLPARAESLGSWLSQALEELAERHSAIGDVRGRGLMIGVEIVDSLGVEDVASAQALLETMRERAFLLGMTGRARNVLTFMPPLVVEKRDLEDLIEALDGVLTEREES